jgi:hypothetical protein
MQNVQEEKRKEHMRTNTPTPHQAPHMFSKHQTLRNEL